MKENNLECASITVTDRARFGGLQLRVTILCGLVAMFDGFDTQAIAYVAPSIAGDWALEMSSFGPIFGGGLAGLSLGAFLLSPVADRIGRKPVILASTLIFGVFALLTAWANSLPMLLALRFLTGVGLGGAMPNLIALTSEYAPTRLKSTLVMLMFCGFPLGSTLGGLISAPLVDSHGWSAVFIVGGLLPLLLLPVLYIHLPESARFLALHSGKDAHIGRILGNIDPAASPTAFAEAVRAQAAAAGLRQHSKVTELFMHGRARTTTLLWLAFFMNLLVMYFLVNWLPSLLRTSGMPLQIAILSTAVLNLGGVAGAIILGRLIDRRSPFLILGSAYAAAGLFIAVIAFSASSLPLLLTATALAGFGIVGSQIGLNAVAAATYPTAIRATGVGWALGIGRIGSIVGPTAGGILLGWGWSPQELIIATVLPALIASAAVFALQGSPAGDST